MIQVYTGDGKGKTTAALGLALRAAGAGFKVYIAQFLKCGDFSELKALRKIKNIKVEQFGCRGFIRRTPAIKDKKLAVCGLKKVRELLVKGNYQLVILDEINAAIKLKLLDLSDVVYLLKQVNKKTEVVLTGRNAHAEILKIADLVSEIRERKHYYKKGLKARKGFEF